jgi:hypothetical protein
MLWNLTKPDLKTERIASASYLWYQHQEKWTLGLHIRNMQRAEKKSGKNAPKQNSNTYTRNIKTFQRPNGFCIQALSPPLKHYFNLFKLVPG